MKKDDALEFGDYLANSTPFASDMSTWVHIAYLVRKATDWEDALRICREYGMTTSFQVASEIAEAYELHDFAFDELAKYFGVPRNRLDKVLDAFLPHQNPKTKQWGEAYRQDLAAIREDLAKHPNNIPI